ncbi:MAG: T9SS type A sorting domain-containing protein [Coprobacter sp.]|nr:T9SS type A sorting domain-containing protein [Coprobacter sp.]
MKRTILLSSAVLAMWAFCSRISAQQVENSNSTSTDVYDISTPWDNDQILKLFSDAWDKGSNYPTKEAFEEIGLTIDREFVRSHTRFRNIDKNADKDIVSDINHDRRLWCNIPGGYGKVTGGYPSTEFDQDVFSMWNYTHLFGAWNYGFLQAPGSWVDAAHKNGTRIYGGIKFFEGWNNDGSEGAFKNFVSTKATSGKYQYKYSRAFVNAACYFGNDGYNYNSEGSVYTTTDWMNFHSEVRNIARELGLDGFGIGQYTNYSSLSDYMMRELYGSDSDGIIYDCMLNYTSNKLGYRNVPSTIAAVAKTNLGLQDVYQGHWLVGLSNDYWSEMNTATTKQMNICIWGEHDQSRFFQFRIGEGPTNVQENYQLLLEKAFSGANRNPLKRPDISNNWGSFQVANPEQADQQLDNSPGFASMFPERTAINGKLPFQTFFSLGNGENYFYKGKVTNGPWYNMSQQDIVPTYRWLVTAKGNMKTYANDIDVRFTHEDAYIGGSSIRLSGATTAGNDVILYRSNLTVSGKNPQATVALKRFAAGASHLSLILKKTGSDNWIEVPCGNLNSAGWETQTLPISGLSTGDVIEYIGFRVNGTDRDYKVLVGQLTIADDYAVKAPAIDESSLLAEVKEETANSLSVKLTWEPEYSGYKTSINDFGMVWNDEINVDHFEIFYKDSEDGTVREMGRTSQWATYIGGIPKKGTSGYIGVRSVSEDLKSVSAVAWLEIPYTPNLPEVEEEDPYGKSWMSSIGNGTLTNCIRYIFAQSVTTTGATQDLNYSTNSNPLQGNSEEQYYFAKEHKLILTQGQTVNLTFKGYESNTSECIEYDFINAYIDYDGNYSFLDADEVLGKFGNLNSGTKAITTPGLTITFKVPDDAHLGESRLRFVASDAWTPHPGPTGGTVKGYTIDFPVEIQGTNPDRGPAKTYKDFRDDGEAEEPEHIDGSYTGMEKVAAEPAAISGVVLSGDIACFANTDKAWFFDMNGRMVKFVTDATETVSVSDLAAGVYVVKMQNGQVIRSTKVVKK